MKIYNIRGRFIRTLSDNPKLVRRHSLQDNHGDNIIQSVKGGWGSMTRMLKFLSILLLASLLLTVILGLFVRPNTYITRAVVIESPVNVVWRHLIDYNNYRIWQKGIKKVVFNNGDELWEGATLRFYSMDYENEIAHEERVVKLENDTQISFKREGQNENALLKDFQTTYLIKRLLDGTTELSVRVSYYTTSFVTRIYNQLYLRSSYAEDCEKNLTALRKLIENS